MKATGSYKQCPLKRSDIRLHELDGEALMFDPVSSDTHRLNETALFVWRHCDGRHDAKQVARELTRVYDVDSECAFESVQRLLEEFESRGLVISDDDDEARGNVE